MIRINLISEGKKVSGARAARLRALSINEETIATWAVAAAFLVVALGYGVYWLVLNRHLASQREEIAELEETVAELEEIIAQVERFERQKAELEHKIQVITNLRNNQRGPVHIMDQVSRALPDFLWLDRMDMNASTVTINGKAFTTSSVANFVENLDVVDEFQEPFLRNATWRGQVYDFQVSFNYTPVPVGQRLEEEAVEVASGELAQEAAR